MSAAPRMDLPGFLRLHGLRVPSLMWLLGAGSSAAAGVPTAWHMIWEFKRAIFCSEERVSLAACEHLSDPAVRERIQRHFAAADGHPPLDDVSEYAHYFELAYPDEGDRRRYIDAKVKGAEPSYGHTALAALMTAGHVRVVWSTNFDPCLETSSARAFNSTAHLAVATLDNPSLAEEALSDERFPLAVKLHGDFQSRHLKNVRDELREQDVRLRRALIAACGRYGLIVCGYSGRDASVMEALEEAAVEGGFPAGLFWVHCASDPPSQRVEAVVAKAAAAGVTAAIIEAQTFDELLGDLLRQTPNVPEELLAIAEQQAPRVSSAPIPVHGAGWPVIRTNALSVVEWPQTCRRLEASIGGAKALREVIAVADVQDQVIAARTRAGVLAFGSDAALRTALHENEPQPGDLHAIETARLNWESGEHGLMAEALARALARERPLLARRRRAQWVLVVDPHGRSDSALAPLLAAAKTLIGTLPSGAHWGEAVALRLDWRLDRLWLLLDPIIWATRSQGPRPARDMDFIRERRARRYNPQADELLQAWIDVLLGGETLARVSSFGSTDGVDAAFVLDGTTAYSRRAQVVGAAEREEAA